MNKPKLTTVLSCVNDNPKYFMFIPKQIVFWGKFGIKFICVFVGEKIPDCLLDFKENIILWNKNLDLNTAYVAQNLRIYYPALIDLPLNEFVMITDMDMLPTNDVYYKDINEFNNDDFIYYRDIDGNQIYMCYNSAHPSTWSKIFEIKDENDISKKLLENYDKHYNGTPGSTGWFIDQEIMYEKLINFPNLKVLNRPLKRLEINMYHDHLNRGEKDFLKSYDDVHFHRDYFNNEQIILDAERQILMY